MLNSTLVHALSGFWHRFFADLTDLDFMYRGVEELTGQLYLDLMYEVLGSSIAETPLTRREMFRLWVYEDGDVRRVGSAWALSPPVKWQALRYLQDSVLAPSAVLTDEADFRLSPGLVRFKGDPRLLLPQAATRYKTVPVGGVLTTKDAADIGAGDVIRLDDGRELVVRHANENGLAFLPGAGISTGRTGVRWQPVGALPNALPRTGTLVSTQEAVVVERAMWALEGSVDDQLLYRAYGNLLTEERPSTEQYRALLLGLMRLHTHGPALKKLEEGIAAVVGLPLGHKDGEIVLALEGPTLTTNIATYRVPPGIKWRPEIGVGSVLRAFQSLSDGVGVYDETSAPRWWLGITLPENLIPKTPPESRVVHADLFENRIGPTYGGVIGDPGAVIGDPWRYSTAYVLTDSIFKHQLFGVYIYPSLVNSRAEFEKLKELVWDVRPSHKVPYFWEPIRLRDTVLAQDPYLAAS